MSSIDYITEKMLLNSIQESKNPRQSREKIIAEKMEIEKKRREIIVSERFERHLIAYRQKNM